MKELVKLHGTLVQKGGEILKNLGNRSSGRQGQKGSKELTLTKNRDVKRKFLSGYEPRKGGRGKRRKRKGQK